MSDDSIFRAAWDDQHEAAVEQAENILKAVSAASDSGFLERSFNSAERMNVPFHMTFIGQKKFSWMESAKTFNAAKPDLCNHVDLRYPAVWCINIFSANRITCSDCAIEEADDNYENSPNICDCCEVAGVSEFHEVMVQTGNFLIAGNICPGCFRQQSYGRSDNGSDTLTKLSEEMGVDLSALDAEMDNIVRNGED